MTEDTPRDGEVQQDGVTPDIPPTVPERPTVLESAMATGEDEGTPGERGAVDPDDPTEIAVVDDAPDLSEAGGPQGDGLEPRFAEPTD